MQVNAHYISNVIQTHMVPVLLGSHRKLFPSFHQEDTGITDFSRSRFTQSARQLQFVRHGLREKNIPSLAQRVHM